MKKNKILYTYKNKIILTNGASLNIKSIKYTKNYELNINFFEKNKINKNFKNILNQKKINFINKLK